MKKMVALTLALVLTLFLAACEDSGPAFTGVNKTPSVSSSPGASSSAVNTSKPGQTTAQTQQPGGKIDHAVVGYWASTDFFSYNEIYTGNYVNSSNAVEGWIFESDGTFLFFLHTSDNRYPLLNGLSQAKGQFRIEGNTIYCTNVVESWKNYDNPDRSYDFRTRDNFRLIYEIRDNGEAIGINMNNLYWDFDPDVPFKHYHYVEE